MTEDTTVVERLERLAGIIEEHERGLLEGTEDLALDEVKHGVRNAACDLREVVDDDVRDCTHCGSPFTFCRADGDIACKDCPGIMPDDPDINTGACPDCGSYDTRTNPAEPATGYTGQPDDAVVRVCEACNGENLIVSQDADRRIEA